ncbi:hypothetical protein KZP23_10915 [Echinicola marina]|uniref:hypothetical protein n=1 Tax=Echinicola marina TaxID=2859768 RepID=UPI001CF6D4D6|nr:hypothetical protein [Echinicola marina]UCS95479.1 hypothetical protein KZP23_10915 [Echinicola marina]
MKKYVFILAIGMLMSTGLQAMELFPTSAMELSAQDKVEIAPEDLPQPVKDAIADSDETKDWTISKVYQMTDDEGSVIYKVIFGEGEESITKKYDAEGKEIKED